MVMAIKSIHVVILSSENDEYNAFKKVWIENILSIKKNNDINYEFYFVYGGCNSFKIVNNGSYNDIFTTAPETIHGMLDKTLQIFEHLYCHNTSGYVMRTNLSTLFNFNGLKKWFDNMPELNLFGGSYINGFSNKNTLISGVNMTISWDILGDIVKHKRHLKNNLQKLNEDIQISRFVFNTRNPLTKCMGRIDFLEKRITFHKCFSKDLSVYCFRFKSNNRENDVVKMRKLLDSQFDTELFVRNCKLPIFQEMPQYSKLFNKPFLAHV